MSSRARFCVLSHNSLVRSVASKARTMPGTGTPVAFPESGAEVHMMPVPVRLPLAETERAAALENPEEFWIVLCETAVVLNVDPVNWNALRKSPGPQI